MLAHAHRLPTATRLLARRSCQGAVTQLRWHSSEQSRHEIAVLGGGITGLATAYYLSKSLPRANITLYEACDRVGGWLSATRVPVQDGTILFEKGPRTLRPTLNGALAGSLLHELDLGKDAIFTSRLTPAHRNRYIYYPDRLTRLPNPAFGLAENIWSCLTEPALEGILWAGMSEYFKPARNPDIRDESVGDFFSRRFGKRSAERLVSALMHGIYAGDAWQLSMKSLFPTVWRAEEKSGSVSRGFLESRIEPEIPKCDGDFLPAAQKMTEAVDPLLKATLAQTSVFTFKDGLGMLPEKLARKCVEAGNLQFRTSCQVQEMCPSGPNDSKIRISTGDGQQPQEYDHVISALAPWHLNAINKSPRGSSLIPQISAVNVMTVNLYYREPNLTPPGFGYLIPQATPFEQNPERALGVIFDNAYSPSPEDLDQKNWQITDMEALKEYREQGQLVDVNGFSWYNMPERPNAQDEVPQRGTKLTVMLGGHYWNDWPAFPNEEEALELAKSVLQRHLKIEQTPEAWQATMQRNCIPQYEVGHNDRLKQAHNSLWNQYRGRLRVAGNWIWGVGVNDALRSAWEVVEGLRKGRDGTGLEHVGSNEFVRVARKTKEDSDGDRR